MPRFPRLLTLRRLLRFRLRSLLVMTAFAAVLLAWWGDRRRLEERIAQRDDLLAVLGMAPEGFFADLLEDPLTEGLFFHNADDVLKSLRDDSVWTGPDGKCPKAFFERGDVREQAIPLLLPLLKDADAKVRSRVAYVLRCLGHLSPTVAPALLAAARHESAEVRFEAILALNEIEGPVEGLGADLAGGLDGDRPEELEAIITTIRARDSAYDLNPRLWGLLAHANSKTRATAAQRIEVPPSTSREDVSKLLAMLEDSDTDCRIAGAEALAGLAANDASAERPVPVTEVVDVLVRAFKNEPEPKVRRAIAYSVERLHRRTGG